ncbi:MAG: hypothetical protein RXQ00_05720 [Caldivirga sp.]|jgi:hypothetical protein
METRPLIIKPILLYAEYKKVEGSSWRNWGGIQSRKDAESELLRIRDELNKFMEHLDFPVKILSADMVSELKELEGIAQDINLSDLVLLYAAGSRLIFTPGIEAPAVSLDEIRYLVSKKPVIVFIKYKTGPLYLWYEIMHARFIRLNVNDNPAQPWLTYDDVVVDDYEELLWKLRALYALKNVRGRRVLSIGGVSGWEIGAKAAENAQKIWGLDIVNIPYSELEEEIHYVERNEKDLVNKVLQNYFSLGDVKVEIPQGNVERAIILYRALRRLAERYNADAVTSPGCMSSVIKIAKTPPCFTYSILNDEGLPSICEGDFVVIPAFLFLRYLTNKPVFMGNPTYPHNNRVLMAHCTAPRKMDGRNPEPAVLLTHYESDEGAAIKVLMRKGQVVTIVDPSFDGKSWVIFRGKIMDTPSYPACRTQVEIEIEGDWKLLRKKLRGFHWLLVYGDYLKEIEYALEKIGIEPILIQ